MLLGRNGGWRCTSICIYIGNAVGGLLLLFHTIKLKDEGMSTVESTVWTVSVLLFTVTFPALLAHSLTPPLTSLTHQIVQHHYLSIVLGVSCGALWITATQVRPDRFRAVPLPSFHRSGFGLERMEHR